MASAARLVSRAAVSRTNEASECEGAEQFAKRAIAVEGVPAEQVVPRKERELMHNAIGSENFPSSLTDPGADWGEPLAPVEGLVACAAGVTETRVNLAETQEVEVVRGCQEKFAGWFRNAVHLSKSSVNEWQSAPAG